MRKIALFASIVSASAYGNQDAYRFFVKEEVVDGEVLYSFRILKPLTSNMTSFELGANPTGEPQLKEFPVGFKLTDKSNFDFNFTSFKKKNPSGWKSEVSLQEESNFHWILWLIQQGKSTVGMVELTGFKIYTPRSDETYKSSSVRFFDAAAEYAKSSVRVTAEKEVSTPISEKVFTLSARKKFSPGASEPAEKTLDENVFFAIPGKIPVSVGNAGNGQSVLKFKPLGQISEVTCTYKGGSSSMKPTSVHDINAGKEYILVKCSDGRVAGDVATAGWIKLELKSAVNGGKKSLAQADLDIIPLR